jgi:hypothetical protein
MLNHESVIPSGEREEGGLLSLTSEHNFCIRVGALEKEASSVKKGGLYGGTADLLWGRPSFPVYVVRPISSGVS